MLKLNWNKIYRTEYLKDKSTLKIANKYKCAKRTVRTNFLKLDLKLRTQKEARALVDVKTIVGKGKDHSSWKGGKTINPAGYIFQKVDAYHPRKNDKGYVFEHILVMEKYLGRYLILKEEIHHLDFVRTNNKIENLYLFKNRSKHQKYHWFLRKLVLTLIKRRYTFFPLKISNQIGR